MRLVVLLCAALLFTASCAVAQTRPAQTQASLVDLNSASQDALMGLEGIGEVRADAIVRARPFKAKTELVERHIIPESLYEKLADKVTVRPLPGASPATPQSAPAGTRR